MNTNNLQVMFVRRVNVATDKLWARLLKIAHPQ